MILIVVGVLLVAFVMYESPEEKLTRELQSLGVDVKIYHLENKKCRVEISRALPGLQFQHAAFFGSNLLLLLEEALAYVEKYIEDWLNHGGYF